MSLSLKTLHLRITSFLKDNDTTVDLQPTEASSDQRESSTPSRTLADRLYFLAVVGSVVLVGVFIAQFLNFSRYPLEDAAMLMRYSQHLGQGYGIVWNLGDRPVDGGTDFLYLVLLGLFVKAALGVEIAARVVGILAHLLTAIIIYFAIIRFHNNRWLALLSATYLAIGPGLSYIAAYFGTTVFALFACITWYFANRLVRETNSHRTSMLFAVSGLVMGLIRPEGVLLAIFMLLGIIFMKGISGSRRIIVYFIAVFLFIGGAYFLWRWHYFGYPLPNPFYKKGGGNLYFSSLQDSVTNVAHLCGPFLLAFIVGFRSAKTARQSIFLLLPVAGFTAIWILLSNEMNYLGRFQYAVLPLVLVSWPALVKGVWEDLRFPQLKALERRNQLLFISIIVLICLGTLGYQYTRDAQEVHSRDGRYDVAMMLSSYAQKNYTMATTESGLLPLYSHWRDIDTWGLNDQWIAHHGQITEAYLDSYKPELIMFHAPFSPEVPLKNYGGTDDRSIKWFAMVKTLNDYAESHAYILAAAFGVSRYDTHYYYVRSGFPDSGDIVRKIQSIDYYLTGSGEKCVNYAQLQSH
jgi:arabinofuranosyltransferase